MMQEMSTGDELCVCELPPPIHLAMKDYLGLDVGHCSTCNLLNVDPALQPTPAGPGNNTISPHGQ